MDKKTLEHHVNLAAADFIRKKRRELGLTQTDVARSLGIKQPELSKIEKGQSKLTLTNFVRFVSTYAPEIKRYLPFSSILSLYILLNFISRP